MIELNDKTRKDFLDKKTVQSLLDNGINMDDAEYGIYFNELEADLDEEGTVEEKLYVGLQGQVPNSLGWVCPTYSLQNLLDKVHEILKNAKDTIFKYEGTLRICKEDPLYRFYCYFKDDRSSVTSELKASESTLIESLALILLKLKEQAKKNE